MDKIVVRGARTHNLKNIDLELPRDKLIVITGLSGSGKSSLAFNTLYAEGQRRYVESLSTYARQFLSMMEKPDVDHIEGLSPAISIEQKSTSHNPRSTVGTITEIYDYLRLLYARAGTPQCPDHGLPLEAQTVSQMVDSILELEDETRIMVLAPVIRDRKGEHLQLFEQLRSQGYVRARIDGVVYELDELPDLEKNKKHHIDVIVDRLKVRPEAKLRLTESLENALELADGLATVSLMDGDASDLVFSARFACPTGRPYRPDRADRFDPQAEVCCASESMVMHATVAAGSGWPHRGQPTASPAAPAGTARIQAGAASDATLTEFLRCGQLCISDRRCCAAALRALCVPSIRKQLLRPSGSKLGPSP